MNSNENGKVPTPDAKGTESYGVYIGASVADARKMTAAGHSAPSKLSAIAYGENNYSGRYVVRLQVIGPVVATPGQFCGHCGAEKPQGADPGDFE